jgi:hypothetical protein
MERRLKRAGASVPAPEGTSIKEIPLHNEIMRHCSEQWPRWKYIRARSDRESTIAEGCQDFTIFLPSGRVACIECKSKTGKLSPAQRDWAHEMKALGHTVHECRSFEQFLNIIEQIQKAL